MAILYRKYHWHVITHSGSQLRTRQKYITCSTFQLRAVMTSSLPKLKRTTSSSSPWVQKASDLIPPPRKITRLLIPRLCIIYSELVAAIPWVPDTVLGTSYLLFTASSFRHNHTSIASPEDISIVNCCIGVLVSGKMTLYYSLVSLFCISLCGLTPDPPCRIADHGVAYSSGCADDRSRIVLITQLQAILTCSV